MTRDEYHEEYYKKNKESISLKSKAYYEKNKEKIKQRVREYRANNKEEILERYKKWVSKNPDKVKEIKRRWNEKNKEYFRKMQSEWRANNPEKNLENQRGWASKNREKILKSRERYKMNNGDIIKNRSKEWHKNNRESVSNRKRYIKYGMTAEDYQNMFDKQEGVCKICNQPETSVNSKKTGINPLAVDHDHKSGKVRALLCSRCNRAIGMFGDSVELLMASIAYLKEYNNDSLEE